MRQLSKYEEFLERKQWEYGDKFDASELDLRFVSAFNNGTRLKVDWYGELLTGTVGVTSGWKPAFLLMRTKRSLGSSILLGPSEKIIAVQRGREYVSI